MLVGERMKKLVITVTKDVPIQEALAMMKRDKFRRLPVVDERGKLIGIVTESDLLNASPSDATSLSVWEINYLLSKITIEKVMTTRVITVAEDTPIEEAARIMSDNKIGGLPVCHRGHPPYVCRHDHQTGQRVLHGASFRRLSFPQGLHQQHEKGDRQPALDPSHVFQVHGGHGEVRLQLAVPLLDDRLSFVGPQHPVSQLLASGMFTRASDVATA